MDRFEAMIRGNREALAMAGRLIDIASAMPLDVKAVAEYRQEMVRRVTQQVSDKNRLLADPLRNSPNPADRALAHKHTTEILKLRQILAEHHGRWTIREIEKDPREYRLALRVQLKRMQAHLDWEETELMPAAATLLARGGRRAAA